MNMNMNRWLSFKRSSFISGNGRNVSGGEEKEDGDDKKTVSWSKYLVSSGGEIKAGGDGEDDQWSADMSKLLIGSRFASGRHSRIYHGMYNENEVAVKIVSVPEDEDQALASLMEKQFISEVSLLFCLKHPNIISNARPYLPAHCPPALGNLITHCWASNPEKRPHFSEIISVLEYYNESFNRDPEFFLSCKPFEQRRVLGCVPRLIPSRRSALLFT